MEINQTLANPGLLILLIYFPIMFLASNKKFQKNFHKIHSKKLQVIAEVVIGVLYFLIILYASTLQLANSLHLVIAGTLIYIIGLSLTYWGYHAFITSSGGLIAKSPYKFSRNPTYFFAFIAIAGLALATTSKFLLALLIIQMAFTHKIILREEQYLQKTYKKAYSNYSDKVRRYI